MGEEGGIALGEKVPAGDTDLPRGRRLNRKEGPEQKENREGHVSMRTEKQLPLGSGKGLSKERGR